MRSEEVTRFMILMAVIPVTLHKKPMIAWKRQYLFGAIVFEIPFSGFEKDVISFSSRGRVPPSFLPEGLVK